MRSGFATRGGFILARTPTHRQQAARRRLLVACAVAALALVSGAIGALTAPAPALTAKPAAGPFSYFPSE